MRVAAMPRSVKYRLALAARRWPSAMLYSTDPRSSVWPATRIVRSGFAMSTGTFASSVARASSRSSPVEIEVNYRGDGVAEPCLVAGCRRGFVGATNAVVVRALPSERRVASSLCAGDRVSNGRTVDRRRCRSRRRRGGDFRFLMARTDNDYRGDHGDRDRASSGTGVCCHRRFSPERLRWEDVWGPQEGTFGAEAMTPSYGRLAAVVDALAPSRGDQAGNSAPAARLSCRRRPDSVSSTQSSLPPLRVEANTT